MQRRQLDRDAGAVDRPAAGGRRADGVDGMLVGLPVAPGVGGGHGGLAEHVVGMAETRPRTVAGERLLDRLAVDELLAHEPHRAVDGAADQRLAAARHQPGERADRPVAIVRPDQPAGDEQPPGGGVDQRRIAAAEMRAPVAVAELVADQRVARRRVGNAQHRLGQAHQRHALGRRQRELVDQSLHQAFAARRRGGALAQPGGEPPGEPVRVAGLFGRQPGGVEQRRKGSGFGRPGGGGDGGAQARRPFRATGGGRIEAGERRSHGSDSGRTARSIRRGGGRSAVGRRSARVERHRQGPVAGGMGGVGPL